MSSKSEQPSRSFANSVYTAIPSLIMKASDLFGWPRTSRVTSADREQEPTEQTVPHANLPIRSGRRSADAAKSSSPMGSSPTHDTVTFADPLVTEEAQSSQAQGSDGARPSLIMAGANGDGTSPVDEYTQTQTNGNEAEPSDGGQPTPGNPTDAGSYSSSRGRPSVPYDDAYSRMTRDQAAAEQASRQALIDKIEAKKRAMASKSDHMSAGPKPTWPSERTSRPYDGQSSKATVAEEMARMGMKERRSRESGQPTCASGPALPKNPVDVSFGSNTKHTVRPEEAMIEKYRSRLRDMERKLQESRKSQASTKPHTQAGPAYVTVYGGKVSFENCSFRS